LVPVGIPGLGVLVTVLIVGLVGFFSSNVIGSGVVESAERFLGRVPFVKLVYSSIKDLINAFVGEKKSFDKPVLVELFPGGHANVLGFVTQESLSQLGRDSMVSVYVPQSYHWAGQVYVFPAKVIQRLDASSAGVMAFIVSGGVAEIARPVAESADGEPSVSAKARSA